MHTAISVVVACATLMSAATPQAGGRRNELDHMGAYNFTVDIEGVNAGYFKAVDGLGAEAETVSYQDGDDIILRSTQGSKIVRLETGVLVGALLEKRIGAPPAMLDLPLVFRSNTSELASEELCRFRLRQAEILDVQRREVVVGEDTLTMYDVVLRAGARDHDCDRYFLPPEQRP